MEERLKEKIQEFIKKADEAAKRNNDKKLKLEVEAIKFELDGKGTGRGSHFSMYLPH